MNASRFAAALAVAIALTLSVLVSAQASGAPTSNGPVMGELKADTVYGFALCDRDCDYGFKPGTDEVTGHPMSAPDYYKLSVASNGDFTSSEPVQAGTYKILFYGKEHAGEKYKDSGYLRALGGGRYSLKNFASGNSFTITAGQSVNLGAFNLDYIPTSISGGDLHEQSFGGGYTSASEEFYAKGFPAKSKLTIKSYGCGTVKTTRVLHESGNFTYNWKDDEASRHYEKSLKIKVYLTSNRKTTVVDHETWSVKSYPLEVPLSRHQ